MGKVNEADVAKLLAYFRQLPLDFQANAPEFNYTSAVLVLADAVLSAHRKYEGFVKPRLGLLRAQNPPLATLDDLLGLIERVSVDGFCKVWNYQYPDKVKTLQELAGYFKHYQLKHQTANDMSALKHWANAVSPADFPSFRVPGIGFTTFQYLRMLCGADTTPLRDQEACGSEVAAYSLSPNRVRRELQ